MESTIEYFKVFIMAGIDTDIVIPIVAIDTLINNKEILVKNTQVVIPDTG